MAGRLSYVEKQKLLDTHPKLYFAEGIEINSLGDIIYQLFLSGFSRETFKYNVEGVLRRQGTGWARSVEDCYRLCKAYLFSEYTYTSIKRAISALYAYHNNGNGVYHKVNIPDCVKLNQGYCSTVKRLVHSRYRYQKVTREDVNKALDSLGLNIYNKGEDGGVIAVK